jgi:hypothetical protein
LRDLRAHTRGDQSGFAQMTGRLAISRRELIAGRSDLAHRPSRPVPPSCEMRTKPPSARRDDEEDCEQMLIDELHVREVVARTAIPLHLPAEGK